MSAIETAGMFANPRHLCHVHQMFLNAMALMDEVLIDRELQIVLLHCGLGPAKTLLTFPSWHCFFRSKVGSVLKPSK